MKILVCFKALPDPDKIVAEDWENFSLETDILYAGLDLNCFDQSALEIGLKIKEQEAVRGVEATCTALTVSERVSSGIACNLYSVGYDEVLCLPLKQREFQPEKIADILYNYAKDNNFDVVITGEEAGMAETGMVPYILAEKLKYPIITGVESVALEDGLLCADCRNEEGLIEKKITTPVVINIGNSPAVLRMATLKKRMAFMGRKATVLENSVEDVNPNPTLKRPETGRTCSMLETGDDGFASVSSAVLEELKNAASKERSAAADNSEDTSSDLSEVLAGAAVYFETENENGTDYDLLIEKYREEKPSVVVLPDSENGRILAVRLSQEENINCIFDAEIEAADKDCLIVKKRVFSANLEWQKKLDLPAVLTVSENESKRLASVKHIKLENTACKAEWIKSQKLIEAAEPNLLESSKVVIACGAGLRSKDACDKARKLAERLDAGIGFTRVAALNSWGAATEIIGQSGSVISPECVLVLGAAGAGAFAVGIEKAGKIIAVNTDKSALIFKNADIGINMDAETLVDKLLELTD